MAAAVAAAPAAAPVSTSAAAERKGNSVVVQSAVQLRGEPQSRFNKHKDCITQVKVHIEEVLNAALALETQSGDDAASPERKAIAQLEDAIRRFAATEWQFRVQQDALMAVKDELKLRTDHELFDTEHPRDWAAHIDALAEAVRKDPAKEADRKARRNDHIHGFRRKIHDIHHSGEPLPKRKRTPGGPADDDDDDDGDGAGGAGGGDEELSVVGDNSEEKHALVCPITQQPLDADVQPLQNPDCKHTYSAAGIRAHVDAKVASTRRGRAKLTQDAIDNTRVPCPVAGCGKTLTHARLEKNIALVNRIAANERKRAAAAASGTAGGRNGSGGGSASGSGGSAATKRSEEMVDFTQDDGAQPPLAAAAVADVDASPDDISQTQTASAASKRRKGARGDVIRVKKEKPPSASQSTVAGLPDDPVSPA